jgi:hypothetical protein
MKQRAIIKKAFILFGLIGFISFANAESIQKHPRVAELEDSLRQKASTYLKSRFPDQPFLVNVSVDPLRRASAKGSENESLPFFDTASDEIQDEWDDPNVSLQQLQLRTNKIFVEVSLSDSISDSEVSEVKDNIVQSLHLTPARDEVRIEAKNWKGSSNRYLQSIVALGIAALFLIGLYFINRQSTQKITHALTESAKNSSSNVNGSMNMSATSIKPAEDHHEQDHGSKKGLQLSDPIKVGEILAKTINILENKPIFPTLKTMVALDEYGVHHPSDLGAILIEFRPEMKSKVFSYSGGDWWLEAMMKPSTFGIEQLELLQKLVKEADLGRSPIMEDMLIKVWRLHKKLPDFMRGLSKESGLAVLSYLPKGKAIDAARKAYPGAWADLLDPSYIPKKLSDTECIEIANKAVEVKKLRNPLAIDKHKLEMELREFLLKASVEEEREIYLASKPDSAIHEHRPPFFKILDAEETLLKGFVGRFSPEQWANALFNVSQTERKKIQSHFSEKQNFMFIEHLKRQDRSSDHSPVGKAREYLGVAFKDYQIQLEEQAVQAMKEAQEETKNENQDQAA